MIKYWLAILAGLLGLLFLWWFGCFGHMNLAGGKHPSTSPVATSTVASVPPIPAAPRAANTASSSAGSQNEPVTIAVTYAQEHLRLTGEVPSEEIKTKLFETARIAHPTRNVENDLRVVPNADSGAQWELGKPGMALVNWRPDFKGKAELIDGKSVVLTGTIGSDAAKTTTSRSAENAFGAEIAVDNRLQVMSSLGASAHGQKQSIDNVLKQKTIDFESGKAVLTKSGRVTLDEVAAILKPQNSTQITIIGHTDKEGDPGLNFALSKARAEATLRYLQEQGISPNRMLAKGMGDRQPVASNDTEDGRQRNRRIEFTITGGM